MVTKQISSCRKIFSLQQEHFSYCKKKYLVLRKKIIGARKKVGGKKNLFCHFIQGEFSWCQEKNMSDNFISMHLFPFFRDFLTSF